MNNPYTLENTPNWGIQMYPINLNVHGQRKPLMDLNIPMGGNLLTHVFATGMTPYANDRADLRAPGIRDQIPDPSMVYLGPYRSNLYDNMRNTSANNNPIPNWNENIPSFMQSAQNQRLGAEIWQILQETPQINGIRWSERGQFSVPYTGFSAFRDLKARSTMPFI